MLHWECNLKWVIAKQPLLTSTQNFEKAGIEGVKKDKRWRILCELGSVKKSPRQSLLTKANILNCQNWAKKNMKIDFSKLIFTNLKWHLIDQVDGPHLSNSDVHVAKRRQQGGGSVMIRVGIVDQTIISSFKVDEAVKLNSANYCNFMNKTFFAWYKS